MDGEGATMVESRLAERRLPSPAKKPPRDTVLLGLGAQQIPYHGECEEVLSGSVMQLVPGIDPPWQKRTAVLTRDILGFRMEGTSVIIDHVTLVDITTVEGMNGAADQLSYSVVRAEDQRESTRHLNTAQATSSEGSHTRGHIINLFSDAESQFLGRSYPIRLNSKSEYDAWYSQLQTGVKNAKDAKKQADLSPTMRMQRRARAVFNSTAFQNFFAALIGTRKRVRVGRSSRTRGRAEV